MWLTRLLRKAAQALVAVLALSHAATPARAHGYLALPAARNVQRNSDYCAHCLNAGGPWKVYQRGHPARYGVCGDAWDAPRHHEAGGKYASPPRISRVLRAGSPFLAVVRLTANHKGRWSLRLCPIPGVGAPGVERVVLTQRCLDRHLLRRADGKGPYTPVPQGTYSFAVRYVLPKGVRCARCVLQWTYETGNSCNPPGIANPNPGLESCSKSTNGEAFWNCADVRIR